jgi:uncharacterized protein YqgQ
LIMKTVYDVQEVVRMAGYSEPVEEIAKYLTVEAIECYERHIKEIERHLWDEKMTDKQGDEWRAKKRADLATEIIAINDWLQEERDK